MGRQKVDIYRSGRWWQPYFVSSLKVVIYEGTLRHDNHENAEGEMNKYITCGNWSVLASDKNVTGTSHTKDQFTLRQVFESWQKGRQQILVCHTNSQKRHVYLVGIVL